jgi:hypothetical protein
VIEPTPDTIPKRLRANPWVLWAAEPDPSGGKPKKVPRMIADPTRHASSTDPRTWGTFEDACEAYSALTEDSRWAPLRIAGIGCVLVGDGLVCVDLDGAVTENGLTSAAATIVLHVPTFTEVSPSGRGVHVWVLGVLDRALKRQTIEAYGDKRYIAVTGQRWPGTPSDVESAPHLLDVLNELTRPREAQPLRPIPPGGPVRVRRQSLIGQGTRDNTLFSIAAALVHEGATGPALVNALLDANRRLCTPPLPEADVRRIATSALRGSR